MDENEVTGAWAHLFKPKKKRYQKVENKKTGKRNMPYLDVRMETKKDNFNQNCTKPRFN